jgi:hypothetical protein
MLLGLEGSMGEVVEGSERRHALRVPVQGVAVFYGAGRELRATIENLSITGALVSIPVDTTATIETVELELGVDADRFRARAVRVEHSARRTRIAVEFEHVDARLRGVIDHAIGHALSNATRRPFVVFDGDATRRDLLVSRLRAFGMTALAPATPLEAFDRLANAQRNGCVALLGPSFDQSVIGLRNVICETFPWAVTNVISDDLDATVDRALGAWGDTNPAQVVHAMA